MVCDDEVVNTLPIVLCTYIFLSVLEQVFIIFANQMDS